MTFQIGKARGTNPITEPSKPSAAPSSNVSPGNLSPWPNLATLPTVGPPSAWQKGVVSTAAKEERAAAEQNGTAITIGASEARVAAGEAINHAQTVVSSAGTIAQELATTNTDSEFGGDIVGAAQKGNEEFSRPRSTMTIRLPSSAAKRSRRSTTRGCRANCRWALRLPEIAV